ncbi:MAG: hypothetical protein NWE99_01105 [Candidatus Bathyarchaeota archaeon]|nr:hypothetical protein [Candidatus Bathyarchaeota archaeon]
MDKNDGKKSGKRRRPIFRRHSANGGLSGGASRWKPPPFTPRRDYNYKAEQKHFPKEEKSHWNGRVQVWTEPQKPRQEKVIKYEVDTDKLLNEFARGNKEALNEIAEKLQEATAQDNQEKNDEQYLQKLNSTEKTEASNQESNQSEEPTEHSIKETETIEPEEKTEPIEEGTELTEPVEQNEPQETPQVSENIEQEDPLDAPELVYMSPSFWEQLESEMSEELEQLEPEEELEVSEESEPFSEGY